MNYSLCSAPEINSTQSIFESCFSVEALSVQERLKQFSSGTEDAVTADSCAVTFLLYHTLYCTQFILVHLNTPRSHRSASVRSKMQLGNSYVHVVERHAGMEENL